jgi:hypothetical protein
MNSGNIIKFETLENKLISINSQLLVLYKEVAKLYEIEPRKLRQQLKRNLNKFPKDDAFWLDVPVADFQMYKKRMQSCLKSRMESQYHKYARIWEYIQINTTTGINRPFPVCHMFFPETLFGKNAVINAKLII